MATVKSTEYTNATSGWVPNTKVQGANYEFVQTFNYTTGSALADGDIIEVGVLPEDSVLMGGSFVIDNPGTSCTASVGLNSDTDKFKALTAVVDDVAQSFANTVGTEYQFTSGSDQVVAIEISGSLAADAVVKGEYKFLK